ncbi:MAG: hypothetical protein LJE85_03855 [Gammaproteobacteria bacterium]|nr:hypothetical protein [Gammaproteobacteria bacterium]
MTLRNILIIMALITAGFIYLTFFGEKPDTLVADVVIIKDKDASNLQVEFASPVRHLGHFPEKQGDLLQIKLRAISFHDFNESYSLINTFIQSHEAKDSLITDIRYEGNVPGGPFLTIKFTQPVSYQVNEGDGLKAMLINYKTI